MGSMADTVKEVATKNPDIGWIRIKMFRPFPKQKLQNVLTDRIWDDFPLEKIVVLDRSLSAGQGGHLWQEIQSSLYDVNWRCNPYCQQPKIPGYIIGLNGDDVTPELIEDIHKHSVAASNGCYMREEGVGAWKKIK
jgi:pyruvate/2-oxoacid:ferredoxin oxidoreductase alpha subunit